MTELNGIVSNNLDNKKEFLIKKINNGEHIPGFKTPWNEKKLNNASDKVINKLFDSFLTSNEKNLNKDFLSRKCGVKDFQVLMSDMNSNPLIKNKMTELCVGEKMTGDYTAMEHFGGYIYSRYSTILAPVAALSTIFNHLDWGLFEEIANKKAAAAAVKPDGIGEVVEDFYNDIDELIPNLDAIINE